MGLGEDLPAFTLAHVFRKRPCGIFSAIKGFFCPFLPAAPSKAHSWGLHVNC